MPSMEQVEDFEAVRQWGERYLERVRETCETRTIAARPAMIGPKGGVGQVVAQRWPMGGGLHSHSSEFCR